MFTVKPLTPVRTPTVANGAPRVKVARAPSAIRLLRPLPRIVLACCLPRARAVGLEARTRAVVVLSLASAAAWATPFFSLEDQIRIMLYSLSAQLC